MAQYTKKAIITTFLDMLKTRSLDSITVKDIVDQCEINRNTFYYYFRDIYDLLDHIFELERQKVLDLQDSDQSFQVSLRYVLQVILENRPAIEHVYFSRGRETIERYLIDTANHFAYLYIKKKAEESGISELDCNVLSSFYSGAVYGVILRWIREKNRMTQDELVERLTAIWEATIDEAVRSLRQYP